MFSLYYSYYISPLIPSSFTAINFAKKITVLYILSNFSVAESSLLRSTVLHILILVFSFSVEKLLSVYFSVVKYFLLSNFLFCMVAYIKSYKCLWYPCTFGWSRPLLFCNMLHLCLRHYISEIAAVLQGFWHFPCAPTLLSPGICILHINHVIAGGRSECSEFNLEPIFQLLGWVKHAKAFIITINKL